MRKTPVQTVQKWLSVTNLTPEEQRVFLEKYTNAGGWTPQLKNEFTKIMESSISHSKKEIAKTEQNLKDAKNKAHIKIQPQLDKIKEDMFANINRKSKIAQQQTEQINNAYMKKKAQILKEEISSILAELN